MVSLSSDFIGDFKTGDNINYNLRILRLLYTLHDQAEPGDKPLLRKPIIVTSVSIIEALLYDFHMRMRVFTIEGVTNLAEDVVAYVRGKKLDEFEKLIRSARKHNLFGRKDEAFYDCLDELRKVRNRVHVQNPKPDLPPDEFRVFTEERKVTAEKMLEWLIRFMSNNHPRPQHVTGYVEPFRLPWDSHFPVQ